MKFVSYVRYVEDREAVERVRPAHRDYARALKARGELLLGGPLDEDRGGLFVYEAPSREAAERLIHEDPYFRESILTSWELSEWHIAGSSPLLSDEDG